MSNEPIPTTTEDFGPSPASLWTLSAALREIERLRLALRKIAAVPVSPTPDAVERIIANG